MGDFVGIQAHCLDEFSRPDGAILFHGESELDAAVMNLNANDVPSNVDGLGSFETANQSNHIVLLVRHRSKHSCKDNNIGQSDTAARYLFEYFPCPGPRHSSVHGETARMSQEWHIRT